MKRLSITCVVVACMVSVQAQASGFGTARFGGEHGHPTTSNPTALYFNPAGLALKQGTRLYLDGAIAFRHAAYDRPVGAISSEEGTPPDARDANVGEATLNNFAVIPFGALVSDLGVENLGVGIGVYVPLGGSASWSRNEAFEGARGETYPGAVDGVQRWFTIEGTIRSLYLTAAGAYRIPSWRLSLGAGLNVIQSEVHTVRARNTDGSDDLVDSAGDPKEGRSLIAADSWDLGFSAGLIWEPVDRLWLGASYQSQPGIGEITLRGTLKTRFPGNQVTEEDVELRQSLPDIWRLGARWQPEDRWEFRLFGEYMRWSVFQNQCVVPEGGICDVNEDGSAHPDVIQNVPRQWRDAFGVRAGASRWLTPGLETYLGLGYDSNAIPDHSLDPSLYDMNKLSASLGARVDITSWWALSGTFTQVFYFSRDIEVAESQGFERPSAQPNAAGVYSQAISVLDLSTEFHF